MSYTDMGIVGATTDTFILFENGVRRNRLVLPGVVKCGGSHAVQARPARSYACRKSARRDRRRRDRRIFLQG
jgi:hypothetical protein